MTSHNVDMTSLLLPCPHYREMSRFKVFLYEISNLMQYLGALSNNFEILRKNGEGFLKVEVQLAKFQPIFNLETVLNPQNIGESIFE